jgi:hypothetical protein
MELHIAVIVVTGLLVYRIANPELDHINSRPLAFIFHEQEVGIAPLDRRSFLVAITEKRSDLLLYLRSGTVVEDNGHMALHAVVMVGLGVEPDGDPETLSVHTIVVRYFFADIHIASPGHLTELRWRGTFMSPSRTHEGTEQKEHDENQYCGSHLSSPPFRG